MRKRLTCLAIVAAACVLLSACGSGGGANTATHPTTSKPATHKSMPAKTMAPVSGHTTISIRNFMFSPMTLTVTAGTKVSFHNYDQTAHTATAINGGFNTGTVKPGQSVTVTMHKAGTYKYHCLFHAFMVARIVVVSKTS
jgi:plastocyanin